MAEYVQLKADPREVLGKAARRLAPEGLVPAVMYGHNVEPTSLTIDLHTFALLMSKEALASTILEIDIEGGDKPVKAIVKEIQQHPVSGRVLHVDLFAISMTEKIHTAVPVNFVGDSEGVKEGGTLTQMLTEIDIEALPTDLPDALDVDISELNIGDSVTVSDIVVPDGVEILTDLQSTIASITVAKIVEEEPDELELAEGEFPELGEDGEPIEVEEGAEEAAEADEEG